MSPRNLHACESAGIKVLTVSADYLPMYRTCLSQHVFHHKETYMTNLNNKHYQMVKIINVCSLLFAPNRAAPSIERPLLIFSDLFYSTRFKKILEQSGPNSIKWSYLDEYVSIETTSFTPVTTCTFISLTNFQIWQVYLQRLFAKMMSCSRIYSQSINIYISTEILRCNWSILTFLFLYN